jgi:branched-chain amino acid transport system ATP-binding protein
VLAEIAAMGKTIFLVEQNANLALRLSHRAYVMVTGRIQMSGASAALLDNADVRNAYLGVH